jgi:hypothetical protein
LIAASASATSGWPADARTGCWDEMPMGYYWLPHIYVYIYICICIYVYIYMYIYIHIHIHAILF